MNNQLNVNVSTKAIQSVVTKLNGIQAKYALQECLEGVKIETNQHNNTLRFTVTCLTETLILRIPCEILGTGSILVPFEDFKKMIDSTKGDETSLINENDSLKITSKRLTHKLKRIDDKDNLFPTERDYSQYTKINLPSQFLLSAITKLKNAYDKKEVNSILNSIAINLNSDNTCLAFVATNGSVLNAVSSIPTEQVGSDIKKTYILQADQLSKVSKLIDKKAIDNVFMHIDEQEKKECWIVGDDFEYKITMIEGCSYPKWWNLIPLQDSFKTQAEMNTKGLKEKIEGLIPFSDPKSNIIKFTINDIGTCDLMARNDKSESKDSMDLNTFEGLNTYFGINGKYLLNAIKEIDTNSFSVELQALSLDNRTELMQMMKPIAIKPVNSNNPYYEYYLVMPITMSDKYFA